MAAIVNNNLAGLTITYNDIQFGGDDSNNFSTPPTYSLDGKFIYDRGGIAVKHTEYVLTVKAVFMGNSEQAMGENAEDLQLRLSQPGKVLKIEGIGLGFGTIMHDEEWGPKPLGFKWQNIGFLAWEVVWTVQFCIKHCTNDYRSDKAFTAFNFETSWQNDLDGITSRTIQGSVEIVGKRVNPNSNVPAHVADEVRNNLNIVCPNGFRRVNDTWREGVKKNILEFTISDQMLPGTPPPIGVISADGSCSMYSEGAAVGTRALISISMDIRTSPSFAPELAGVIFMGAALSKQREMTKAGVKSVIPRTFYIMNRKYDGARQTSASMSWSVTDCIQGVMNKAKIWSPLTTNNYQEWRTSIQNLWGNRGAATAIGQGLVASDPKEAVIIDLCTNTSNVVIGKGNLTEQQKEQRANFQFSCPDIPADGGWIFHDLRIRILQKDKQTWHRKALSYLPTPVQSNITSASDTGVNLFNPQYQQASDDQKHDVEWHGLPETYVLLQFRALRALHLPTLPIIKSIAGIVPIQKQAPVEDVNLAFDTISCPVYSLRGYRLYQVNGYIQSVKPTESNTSCSKPNGNKTDY